MIIRLRLLGAALMARDVTKAKAALSGMDGAASRARRALEGAAGGLRAAGNAARTAASWAVQAAAGLTLVGGAVAMIGANYNAMQDRQRVAFTAMTGSAQEAQRIMSSIARLAADSPTLDPGNAGEGVQRLMAYGLAADRALLAVSRIGDSAAAAGKSVEEAMGPAALAIGQIQSRGKLQSEELNQLAESVAVGRAGVARELGMTGPEFERALSAGEIGARRGLDAIFAAMQSRAGGAARMMASTTAGQMDRAREAISSKIGQFTRPFYDAVGRIAGQIGERIGQLDLTAAGEAVFGVVETIATRAIDFLSGIDFAAIFTRVQAVASGAAGVVKQVVDALRPAAPFVQNVILPALKGLATGVIGSVVAAFRVALPIVRTAATALGWVGQKARPLRGLFQGIGTVAGWIFSGPILKLISGMGKLGGVFRLVGGAARVLRVPLQIVGGIVRGVGSAVGFLVGWVGRAITFVHRFASTFRGAASRAITAAGNVIRTAVGTLRDGLTGAAGKLMSAAGTLGRKIVEGIVTVIKNSAGAIGSAIMDAVPGPVRDVVGGALGFAGDLLPFADGGIAPAGRWSLVGERGPELVRFPAHTRVYPAAMSRNMAASAAGDGGGGGGGWLGNLTLNIDGLGAIHRGLVKFERSAQEAR